MARLLLHYQVTLPSTLATFLLLLACIAAVVSIIVSFCSTQKHSKMARENKIRSPISPPKEDRKLIASLSNFSSKAMSVTKMISWKKAADSDSQLPEDEALWKKTIIMGEKCRPMDFSGQILYDSDGNRLPPPDALPEAQRRGQVLSFLEKV